VTIQPYEDRHLEPVVALCLAQGWLSWGDRERTRRALVAPGVTTLVALDDDSVLGVAQVISDGAITAYLSLLVVAETARRRGVGRSLVDAVFAETGLARLDLLSEDGAVGFYRSFPHKVKPGLRIYPSEAA